MPPKRLHKTRLEVVTAILTFSLFLAEVINIFHRAQNINALKFQLCDNSSLWMFQAKEFSVTVTFTINTL